MKHYNVPNQKPNRKWKGQAAIPIHLFPVQYAKTAKGKRARRHKVSEERHRGTKAEAQSMKRMESVLRIPDDFEGFSTVFRLLSFDFFFFLCALCVLCEKRFARTT